MIIMFTGIVEEIGNVESLEQSKGKLVIGIKAPRSHKELSLGGSVAINGVCQTVVKLTKSSFIVEAVEETLKKTSFKKLKRGENVNVELPLKSNGRFGGHIVQGHVDTVGIIVKIKRLSESTLFHVEYPAEHMGLVVPVGSITVDGVSLTVAGSSKNVFSISIIPHTLENTIMKSYAIGTAVNLEFDIIGKYIAQMLKTEHSKTGNPISKSSLHKLGY